MTLGELRARLAPDMTQAEVAKRLRMSTAAVATLEAVRFNDASGNTLSLYLGGLGGSLEAVVHPPDGKARRVRL